MTQCKFTFLSTWTQLLAVQERHKGGTILSSQPHTINLSPAPTQRKYEIHAVAPLPVDIKRTGGWVGGYCFVLRTKGSGEDGHFHP